MGMCSPCAWGDGIIVCLYVGVYALVSVWQGYWSSVRMWECQLLLPVSSLTQFIGIAGFVLVSGVHLTKLFKAMA